MVDVWHSLAACKQVDGMDASVVERDDGRQDPPPVPTISALLTAYRDRTGASYEDMSRSVHGAITTAWFHKLTTAPPSSFPRNAATVQHLADLLQVSVATIVLAFASSLGLPVTQAGSALELSLPPGSDTLTDGDVEAIRAVVLQLIQARSAAGHQVAPDLSRVQGWRLAEEESLRTVEGRNNGT